MGNLIALLVPEIIGLIITPAAIAGAVLLLQSKRPIANVTAFAGAFALVYSQIIVTGLLGGASDPGATSQTISHWVGLAIGVLFLLIGLRVLTHKPDPDAPPPKWLTQLEAATPRTAFAAGALLAVLNPNLFIMMSGLSIISSSDATTGQAIVGALLLFIAAMLDFLVPVGAFLLLGDRAKTGLDSVKRWMLANNRAMTMAVLFGFGAMFTLRGIASLV